MTTIIKDKNGNIKFIIHRDYLPKGLTIDRLIQLAEQKRAKENPPLSSIVDLDEFKKKYEEFLEGDYYE